MKRWIWIVALLALLGFSWMFDPLEGPAIYPRWPVKWLTGWDCPGCGSARALHALLHGRLAEAWAFNPWLPIVLVMALLALIGSNRPGKIRSFIHSPITLTLFVALSIGWMIVRNIYL